MTNWENVCKRMVDHLANLSKGARVLGHIHQAIRINLLERDLAKFIADESSPIHPLFNSAIEMLLKRPEER